MDKRRIILEAIHEILPPENYIAGSALKPSELYIPPAHKKALQLYSNIVVGTRGVGKSTWTMALADPKTQKIVGANITELEKTSVQIGFSESLESEAPLTSSIIKDILGKGFNPYDMWKTVIIRWLCRETNTAIPTGDWSVIISWVRNNPESCLKILVNANSEFRSQRKNGLILFDALDRLSDQWKEMDTIARELLRLILELKPLSNIHTKVFLREDQLSRTITNFPDASKLLSTKTELNWEIYDLHGLLWQQLCNAQGEGGDILRSYYREVTGSEPQRKDDYWVIDNSTKTDEGKLRALFNKLAGPWMGRDVRRGVPYVWSVSHLVGGGNKRASPRSFLNAIRTAAEDSMNRTGDHLLHYESIKKGVQSAAIIRVNEIEEDYPWITRLCRLLTRMNVPTDFQLIEDVWEKEYPTGLPRDGLEKSFPETLEMGWIGFKHELIRLGIFEEMRDGRINMPDLFRVGFGLGRKGGVPPVK